MGKQFIFIDFEKRNIEGKDFYCVYILEFNKKQIFKIYKIANDETLKKLSSFKKFEVINDYVDFVIKRDNKIALNINL